MLKKFSLVMLLLFVFTAIGHTAAWKMDPAHSSVGFIVRHMVISKIPGEFKKFEANITFDEKNIKNGTAEMTVQIASINTDNTKRDNHLRSADFFDAAKYPSMTFKSKKVHDINGNKFKLTGDLTIRGITKEVTFDCELNGFIKDPMGNTRAGFSATTTINRQDFKVSWNKTLDTGGLVVSDNVDINIGLELIKK